MKKTLFTLLSVFILISFAHADLTIKTKVHMDGFEMMGQKQPPTDQVVENWLGKDRMLTNQQDKTFIVRLDQKKMYYISHKGKFYTALDLPIDIVLAHLTEKHPSGETAPKGRKP